MGMAVGLGSKARAMPGARRISHANAGGTSASAISRKPDDLIRHKILKISSVEALYADS
jgi:hypothetical protein